MRLIRSRVGYVLPKMKEQELVDPKPTVEPKPDFCGDHEIFPQNDQEFEEMWQHHFAPRFA